MQEVQPISQEARSKHLSTYVYVSLFGLAGALISVGTFTVYQLASNVGTDTTGLGSMFAPYGGGLFVGLLSVKVKKLSLDAMLIGILIAATAVLILLPFNKVLNMLYLYQFILGASLAFIETGCMYQIRILQGSQSGVYLGLTGVFMSGGYFLIPLVMLLSKNNIYVEYFVVAGGTLIAAMGLLFKSKHEMNVTMQKRDVTNESKAPELESSLNQEVGDSTIEMTPLNDSAADPVQLWGLPAAESDSKTETSTSPTAKNDHYRVELLLCFLFFIFVGQENSIGVFLSQYLTENPAMDSGDYNAYQMIFIATASAGKLLVPVLQWYFPHPRQVRMIINISNVLVLIVTVLWVFVSSALSTHDNNNMEIFPEDRSQRKWFCAFLAVDGIAAGGTLSLAYDVANSITRTSRTGIMLLTGGIYLGSSFFTWIFSSIWQAQEGINRHQVYPIMMVIIKLTITLLFPVLPFISYIDESKVLQAVTSPSPSCDIEFQAIGVLDAQQSIALVDSEEVEEAHKC